MDSILYISDLRRGGVNLGRFPLLKILINYNVSASFIYWLRQCRNNNSFIRLIAMFFRRKLTRKYGIQIPETVLIGPGFWIEHASPIVMHYNVVIGKNCTLHQFVTIGGVEGKAPIIGDNCFIGAGAIILGDIRIGNNVTIGAGAVVTKDIPDNATVCGNPAKIIHYNHPGKYVKYPV